MKEGRLVPELAYRIFSIRFNEPDMQNGYIIDGAPPFIGLFSKSQVSCILNVKVSPEAAMQRAATRKRADDGIIKKRIRDYSRLINHFIPRYSDRIVMVSGEQELDTEVAEAIQLLKDYYSDSTREHVLDHYLATCA